MAGVELVKKMVKLAPQPSESYLVCKLPCLLTEAMLGPTQRSKRKTHCCFTPHYRKDRVPFKTPRLDITTVRPLTPSFAYTPDKVEWIKHLFTEKCTSIQSITVAIMTPELHFKTHQLDTTIAYSHKNYIVMNQHGVMYSRLREDNRLLEPYNIKLAKKLVWIKNRKLLSNPWFTLTATAWSWNTYLQSGCITRTSTR
jgi:hypothetical protein